jgi:hypothetical protein
MILAPKRRRFRFSLRTLFLVFTIACLWLGWNVHKVRQREALIEAIGLGRGRVSTFDDLRFPIPARLRSKETLPFAWSMLGAKSVARIGIPNGKFSTGDLRRIKSLIPEAYIAGKPNSNELETLLYDEALQNDPVMQEVLASLQREIETGKRKTRQPFGARFRSESK